MDNSPRSIRLKETEYTVRRLSSARGRSVSQEVWTIWHGREFVGTIPYVPNESVQELQARSLAWLAPLLS
jgi:hypothetical protein